MKDREIQTYIRKIKEVLRTCLRDFVYDKKIKKEVFLLRLENVKGDLETLISRVSSEKEEKVGEETEIEQ